MALMITSACINCGACVAPCPNQAIYQGGTSWELHGRQHLPLSRINFYIVPDKCTECAGTCDQPACAAACPVDCCVPDRRRTDAIGRWYGSRAAALQDPEVRPEVLRGRPYAALIPGCEEPTTP